MQTVKIADVYQGDSVRADHGREAGLPVYGKFAAIVRTGDVRIAETESGWLVVLPHGSAFGGELGEEEAETLAREWIASERDGWTTDRSAAEAKAIESAKARHNLKAQTSSAYAARYGGAVE